MIHVTEPAPARAQDELRDIRTEWIVVTGTNPRTTFPEDYIAELAESIRGHGVETPLWVRRVSDQHGSTYHLIAGECRLRAAKIANLTEVPCLVKDVDEQTALELQIVENLNRRDVSPIEEGRGYQRLLKEHGYTIEQLIAKLAKSKSYIYGRIKLAELPKLGQEALADGSLVPSIALRVARIPGADLQVKALKQILSSQHLQTDRAAAQLIEQEFCRELKGAPFDPKDKTLNPERGACKTCPYRSGNQADLFPDQVKGRADVCTDPKCYQFKCEATFARTADRVRAAGGEVFEGEACEKIGFHYGWLSHTSPYLDVDSVPNSASDERTWRQLLGEHLPTVSLASRNGKALELIRKDDVQAVVEKHAIQVIAPEHASAREAREAEYKQREQERKEDAAVAQAVTVALLDAVERGKVDFRKEGKLLAAIIAALLEEDYGAAAESIADRFKLVPPNQSEETDSAKVAVTQWLAAGHWTNTDLLTALLQYALAWTNGEQGEHLQNTVARIFEIDTTAIEQETRAQLQNTGQDTPKKKGKRK